MGPSTRAGVSADTVGRLSRLSRLSPLRGRVQPTRRAVAAPANTWAPHPRARARGRSQRASTNRGMIGGRWLPSATFEVQGYITLSSPSESHALAPLVLARWHRAQPSSVRLLAACVDRVNQLIHPIDFQKPLLVFATIAQTLRQLRRIAVWACNAFPALGGSHSPTNLARVNLSEQTPLAIDKLASD
jgi:hypothetical protein